MEKELNFEILTTNSLIFQGSAVEIRVPTRNGEIGILPLHADYVGVIGVGLFKFKSPDKQQFSDQMWLLVGGLCKINDDNVTILADEAYSLESEVCTLLRDQENVLSNTLKDISYEQDPISWIETEKQLRMAQSLR
jgi:F-type H+-transporting ATPase subunit epsilon